MKTANLAPLPLIAHWRAQGLSPAEVRALSDSWVASARQALGLPQAPPHRVYHQPKLRPARAPQPIPVIPYRFPPRGRRGRPPKPDKPAKVKGPSNRKLPDLARLEELYQDHTPQEIAGMFGASLNYVRARLSESGATHRKREARRQAKAEEKAQKARKKRIGLNVKLPSPEALAELYKSHSLREIGEMYGACAEAVRYHLRKTGEIEKKRAATQKELPREEVLALWAKGLSRLAIARTLGLSSSLVSRLTEEAGIPKGQRRRPIPCPDCDTKPYAGGLCHRCYEWVRLEKPLTPEERQAVEARRVLAKRPGPPPGPKPRTIALARRAQAMLAQGKSAREVAAALEVGYTTVYRFIKLEVDKA